MEGEDKTWSSSDLSVVQNVSQLHISMELQRRQQTAGCPKVAMAKCSEIVLHGVAFGSTVTLRGALPGDRFRKAQLAHNIKVTSVLRELGVPPSARPNWPVITIKAPGDGEVVAALLPDLVAANFQPNGASEAQRSAQAPAVINLSWDEAWEGLKDVASWDSNLKHLKRQVRLDSESVQPVMCLETVNRCLGRHFAYQLG